VSTSSKTAKRDRALTEAVETHRGKLRAVIGRRVRDQAEAEDILQDVFLEFLDAYDVGVVFEKLGAWLVRVAQNKILDRFRRQKTRDTYQDELKSSVSQPDEEWTRKWLQTELIQALSGLPPEQREVFIQHELEGKSFEEIARSTGVNLNTLLARKRYAIQYLRDHLKEVYDELE